MLAQVHDEVISYFISAYASRQEAETNLSKYCSLITVQLAYP